MDPMPDGFDSWLTNGQEEDDCICDKPCDCDKCNGEPDDIDIEENIKTREGVRETWVGW